MAGTYIRKWSGKIVSGDLVGRDESLFDQVLGPLVQDLVVLAKIGSIASSLFVTSGQHFHHRVSVE